MRGHILLALLLVVACLSHETDSQNLYKAGDSSAFRRPGRYDTFRIVYIDGTEVQGAMVDDVIHFGPLSGECRFGAATKFSGSLHDEGLVGLGLLNRSDPDFYTPAMYALYNSGAMSPFIFSLWLSDDAGELQLGGYEPASIASPIVWSSLTYKCTQASCIHTDYRINTDAVALGLLLNVLYSGTIETVIDSGYSCITLPTDINGVNMYEAFVRDYNPVLQQSLFVTIQGTVFEVLFSDYFFGGSACIEANDYEENVLVLGDPFYRAAVAIHDLSDEDNPRVGIADRNRGYVPTALTTPKEATDGELRSGQPPPTIGKTLALTKRESSSPKLRGRKGKGGVRHLLASENPEVAVGGTPDQNWYFVEASFGEPAQSGFALQMDTGSSLLIVTADKLPTSGSVIGVSVTFAVVGTLAASAAVYYYLLRPSPGAPRASKTDPTLV